MSNYPKDPYGQNHVPPIYSQDLQRGHSHGCAVPRPPFRPPEHEHYCMPAPNQGGSLAIDPATKVWIINGYNTGVKAEGTMGMPGATPMMNGVTETWWVDNKDTGVPVRGYKGDKGDTGESFYQWATSRLTDQNGDGLVNEADIVKFLTGPRGEKGEGFDTWMRRKLIASGKDINGDGILSDNELKAGFREWFGLNNGPVTQLFVDLLESLPGLPGADLNQDGVIDAAELQIAFNKWLGNKDLGPVTQTFSDLLESIPSDAVGGDTDGDGVISPDELKAAMIKWFGLADTPIEALFHAGLNNVQGTHDANGDGIIDPAELLTAMQEWLGVTPHPVLGAVTQLFVNLLEALQTNGADTNGDGAIDEAELKAAMYDWLHGTDVADGPVTKLFHALLETVISTGGDTDGNGVIDEAELKAAIIAWLAITGGGTHGPVTTLFNDLLETIITAGGDTNGDGVIDEPELKAAMVKWLGVTPQMAQLFFMANSSTDDDVGGGVYTRIDLHEGLDIPKELNSGRYFCIYSWGSYRALPDYDQDMLIESIVIKDIDGNVVPVSGAYLRDLAALDPAYTGGALTIPKSKQAYLDMGKFVKVGDVEITFVGGHAYRYWGVRVQRRTEKFPKVKAAYSYVNLGTWLTESGKPIKFKLGSAPGVSEGHMDVYTEKTSIATKLVRLENMGKQRLAVGTYEPFHTADDVKAGYTGIIMPDRSGWKNTSTAGSTTPLALAEIELGWINRIGGGDGMFGTILMEPVRMEFPHEHIQLFARHLEGSDNADYEIPLFWTISLPQNSFVHQNLSFAIGEMRAVSGRWGSGRGPIVFTIKVHSTEVVKVLGLGCMLT